MTKSYPFYQVDAFTETKLGGNPCAVFLNADDMSDATMLSVAKEVYCLPIGSKELVVWIFNQWNV
jgi:predicted PhzF superfamily epimerase YddE/YHI9